MQYLSCSINYKANMISYARKIRAICKFRTLVFLYNLTKLKKLIQSIYRIEQTKSIKLSWATLNIMWNFHQIDENLTEIYLAIYLITIEYKFEIPVINQKILKYIRKELFCNLHTSFVNLKNQIWNKIFYFYYFQLLEWINIQT